MGRRSRVWTLARRLKSGNYIIRQKVYQTQDVDYVNLYCNYLNDVDDNAFYYVTQRAIPKNAPAEEIESLGKPTVVESNYPRRRLSMNQN